MHINLNIYIYIYIYIYSLHIYNSLLNIIEDTINTCCVIDKKWAKVHISLASFVSDVIDTTIVTM